MSPEQRDKWLVKFVEEIEKDSELELQVLTLIAIRHFPHGIETPKPLVLFPDMSDAEVAEICQEAGARA